jgi:phosphate transport system substrate-binding protein
MKHSRHSQTRYSQNVLKLSMVLLTLAFSSQATLAVSAKQRAQTLQGKPALLLAQATAPAFPMPSSVPAGTTVKLDGSGTMTVINQALKQRFEQQFSGSKIETAAGGTEGALQALLDGKLDVVAIGRQLTSAEKAKGLVEAPIGRGKIAIITSPDNPFRGDISYAQFAKIFRGEITNWSELGGTPGAIRVIDRPDSNDTRLSLSKYEVFKNKPFASGSNTTKLTKDDIATVVKELGKDGISYAIASQVLNQPKVHIVSMHKTLPNDPHYPYSQPRSYVYNKNASPAVQAFLGFAASPTGQETVQAAIAGKKGAVVGAAVSSASPVPKLSPSAAIPAVSAVPSALPNVSPSVAVSPNTTVTTSPTGDTTALLPATDSGGTATGQDTGLGWLWWLLLPLLGGLFWWIFKRDRRPSEEIVTGITPPREVEEIIPGMTPPREPVPVPSLPKAVISDSIPSVPEPNLGVVPAAGVAAVGAAGAAGVVALADRWKRNRMTMTPSDRQLNVAWDVPADHEAALQEQGGQKKLLRLYDITNVNLARQAPNSVKLFDCNEASQLIVPLETGDRDYIGELGYTTHDNRWLKLARSPRIHIPTLPAIGTTALGGAAAAGIAGIAGVAATRSPASEPITPPNITPTDQTVIQSTPEAKTPVVPVTPMPPVTRGGTGAIAPIPENCTISTLKVDGKANCFVIDPQQMQRLQNEVSVSKVLEPGTYIIRLKSGGFSYHSALTSEPMVMLWIYGGRIMNQKNKVPVQATWSTLNGYADALNLQVFETATLCAFFFDTHIGDNEGEVTLTTVKF